jgi:hypothetical protein
MEDNVRRTEMLLKLQEILVELPEDLERASEELLTRIEKLGMAPPCLPSEYCQALMQVYMDPSFNRWEEDVEKDEKIMSAVRRRSRR